MTEDITPKANNPTQIAHWQSYKNRRRPMTSAERREWEKAIRPEKKRSR